jgi:undecaprenyl-diphosphatase
MDLLKLWQTIFLALLQGVTELFPISSLGHTILLPALISWKNLGTDEAFLPLVVALHLGTSIALLLYFWRDWLQVGKTMVSTIKKGGRVDRGTDEWVSWLILIGCIPAGLLGVLLEKPIKGLYTPSAHSSYSLSPQTVAVFTATFLVINGSVLFLGEALRRRSEARFRSMSPKEREMHFRPLKSLTWKEALIVGFAQSLALIPGFSRSGLTMVGGLGVRLTHEDAARYSFLLGTPIILAAAALEVPKLLHSDFPLWIIFVGMVVSGVAAFLSTKFLMKYFETGRLDPFAYYCWGAGLICIILFLGPLAGSL